MNTIKLDPTKKYKVAQGMSTRTIYLGEFSWVLGRSAALLGEYETLEEARACAVAIAALECVDFQDTML